MTSTQTTPRPRRSGTEQAQGQTATPSGGSVPSIVDRIDAAGTDPAALAALGAEPMTESERSYWLGATLAADAAADSRDVESRVRRYQRLGDAIVRLARERINTGAATNTKGEVRSPLASDQVVAFVDVRDAFGLRGKDDRFIPAYPKARGIGRTEAQVCWEANALPPVTAADVESSTLAALGLPERDWNNARRIIEAMAAAQRQRMMTPDQRDAAQKRENERANARAAKDQAEARAKLDAEAWADYVVSPGAGDPAHGVDIAALSDAALLALFSEVNALLDERRSSFIAARTEQAEQEAALALLAARLGVSVEEMAARVGEPVAS